VESWLVAWGLVKVYEGGVVAALVGPNGAGKTTFVRIASALLRPTRRGVEVLGIDAGERCRASEGLLFLLIAFVYLRGRLLELWGCLRRCMDRAYNAS